MACFQPGSFSVNGDEGMTVRVVARRDVITADMLRLQQVAEQVGLSIKRGTKSLLQSKRMKIWDLWTNFCFCSLLYQVFLLDSQVDKASSQKQDTPGSANEEDDQRSYVFVLSSVESKEKPENADRLVY